MNILAKFQVHKIVHYQNMRHFLLKLRYLVNFTFNLLSLEIAQFIVPQI